MVVEIYPSRLGSADEVYIIIEAVMILYKLINIMFVERAQGQQSPLHKQLKMIAQLAHYQPIPSIPAPSMGFNYTLSRTARNSLDQRYSEYQTPRAIRKEKNASFNRSQDLKLCTILQNQNSNHLFPRIMPPVRKESSSFKKVQRLPTHFHKERQQTEATRQRSLTHDTPMSNEDDRLISIENRNNQQPFQTYEKMATIAYQSKRSSKPSQTIEKTIYQDHINEESQSETEGQFEKDAVPGPGTYTYSYSDFDKKSISKKSTKASFNSQSSRFPHLKQKPQPQPEVVINLLQIEKEKRREEKLKLKKSKKHFIPFNSQSPRTFQSDQILKNQGPGPDDYSPRFGIEQELIKKIQRHFKGNFGSNEQRFRLDKSLSLHLGPGSYEFPQVSQSFDGENFYFKSKKHRF